MEDLLVFIASALSIAFWVGLFKPSLVGMPNRKRLALVYLIPCLVIALAKGVLYPTKQSAEEIAADKARAEQAALEAKQFKFSTVTLSSYQSKSQKERQEIINGYLVSEDFPSDASSAFYNCLSEYSATKNDELQIGLVLGWCANDYRKNPKSLDGRTNFDNFFGNFSHWDGSYRPLEKIIKAGMNDEDSYKHIKTTYRVLLKGAPHALVSTIFSGNNAFGGRVKNTVIADVDIKTGQIIEILDSE